MYLNAFNKQLSLSGATNNWNITGQAGGNRYGSSVNDIIQSINGDTLFGGAGDDVYNLWENGSKVVERAGEGIDTINVRYWGTIVLPDNVENVILSGVGATGATGNALDNLMIAGVTGATLDGGAGNDVLVGGAGADVFKVRAGNGSDVIENFQAGWDAVQLDGYGITSFAQVLGSAKQVGKDVSIKLSGSESMTLRNVQLGSLDAADFNFALNVKSTEIVNKSLTQPDQAWNANGWFVLNNAWGVGGMVAGKDYSIKSEFNTADMTKGTTFNWSFPLSTTDMRILAYPEVIFGSGPHNPAGNPTDVAHVFPVQVSDIAALKANYDVSYTGNLGGFNVAYDIWLSNSATATGTGAVSNEVMVWLHKGGFNPFGDLVGTYSNGDLTAKIYHSGTYTAVVADKDMTQGTIDIADILKTLKALGIVSESEYVRSIELGSEVTSGTGSLTINDLDLIVQTKLDNGGTTTKVVGGSGTTVTHEGPPELPPINRPTPTVDILTDAFGNVIGSKTTEAVSSDKTIITKYGLFNNLTGTDVVEVIDKSTTLTRHYNANYMLTGAEKEIRNSGGSVQTINYDSGWNILDSHKVSIDAKGVVTTQYYDAGWVPTGMVTKVVEVDGGILIKYYDAKWVLTGSDHSVTSGNSITTTYFDVSGKKMGADTQISNADGSTTVQHLDAGGALVSAEMIKFVNGAVNTFYYDASLTVQKIETVATDSDGITKMQTYSGSWKLQETSLTGTDMADTIAGTGGLTHFHSGQGSDTLTGGSGVDYFHFDTPIGQGDVDTIKSFQMVKDKIVLDSAIFEGIGVGKLTAAAFAVGTKAKDANDRIIYDHSTGSLYYDPDGTGAQGQVLFAQINADAVLAHTNFQIV